MEIWQSFNTNMFHSQGTHKQLNSKNLYTQIIKKYTVGIPYKNVDDEKNKKHLWNLFTKTRSRDFWTSGPFNLLSRFQETSEQETNPTTKYVRHENFFINYLTT